MKFFRLNFFLQKFPFSSDKGSVEAAFNLILGNKIWKTNFNSVKIFLKGDSIIKTNNRGELCVDNTLVDYYAKRNEIEPSQLIASINKGDMLDINLKFFAFRYYIYRDKLKLRENQENQVVVLYPRVIVELKIKIH